MRTIAEVCQEADLFFMNQSAVHMAAQAISRELKALGIPFAIAGALAANSHGHRRTTADVDILLRREGLELFKQRKLGLGYVQLFEGSKGLRDTVHNVKIDVLLAGEFPGDGKPKPICFPDPADVSQTDRDGLPVLTLKCLLELKLASGMTAPHRMQDLADVMRLIQVNELSLRFADGLHPFVREKFDELWHLAQIQEDF